MTVTLLLHAADPPPASGGKLEHPDAGLDLRLIVPGRFAAIDQKFPASVDGYELSLGQELVGIFLRRKRIF